jgi:very-short-patch-repair endonuclease
MTRFSRRANSTERARELRGSSTEAERRVWNSLRNANLEGASFRRQHPVGPYFVDFMCVPLRLAIELDGGQHVRQQRYDEERTRYLEDMGIHVLRFWNDDVHKNLNGVLETVRRAILARRRDQTPTRRASRADLPLLGGGA